MKRSDSQVVTVPVFLMGVVLLWTGGLGTTVRAADTAPALGAQLRAQEDVSPEKVHAKKRGHVRIATLGPRPLSVDPKAAPQKIVEQEMAHWRHEFSRVLPDRPDLIVVPEACDRPAGLPRDKQLECYRVRKNQVRDFFAKVAAENPCYVVYSAAREMDDGTWRNSSVLIDRQGQIVGVYNKNHVVIEETTVDEMIKEFKIELLDDYMARALAHRHKAGNTE